MGEREKKAHAEEYSGFFPIEYILKDLFDDLSDKIFPITMSAVNLSLSINRMG